MRLKDLGIVITGSGRGIGRSIANAVIFLASSEASYVTGEVLHVTGGIY